MVSSSDVAIVGVGATPYYFRGESHPQTTLELGGKAILAACDDAGLDVTQIDGFAYYSEASAGYTAKMDTATFMETLGIPEVTFTAALTSGGRQASDPRTSTWRSIYDHFTPMVVMQLEDYGFCGAAKAARSSRAARSVTKAVPSR